MISAVRGRAKVGGEARATVTLSRSLPIPVFSIGLKDKAFTLDRGQFRDGQEIQTRIITSNGISANVVTSAPFRISNPSASSQ